ncbi:hypothetical protein PanWU01x14_062780, partial [Parasponia andersonii]
FSALFSCQTPTIAFNIKIRKITSGSTNAVTSFSSSPSYQASTNEMTAAASRIRTRVSLNCSMTKLQIDCPSCFSSSFQPWIFLRSSISPGFSPASTLTRNRSSHSRISFAQAGYVFLSGALKLDEAASFVPKSWPPFPISIQKKRFPSQIETLEFQI